MHHISQGIHSRLPMFFSITHLSDQGRKRGQSIYIRVLRSCRLIYTHAPFKHYPMPTHASFVFWLHNH